MLDKNVLREKKIWFERESQYAEVGNKREKSEGKTQVERVGRRKRKQQSRRNVDANLYGLKKNKKGEKIECLIAKDSAPLIRDVLIPTLFNSL